ncbi:MAG TPA: hypothetical protein DDW50_01275 [Firmicutes bacterium]|nr:hypothetical protein [Bacillota bacterium]
MLKRGDKIMDDHKVAVLLEDLMSQIRTFGEGLQQLNDKVDTGFGTINNRMDKLETRIDRIEANNRQDHQQIIQAIEDLDSEVKRLDTEVVQIKRVK